MNILFQKVLGRMFIRTVQLERMSNNNCGTWKYRLSHTIALLPLSALGVGIPHVPGLPDCWSRCYQRSGPPTTAWIHDNITSQFWLTYSLLCDCFPRLVIFSRSYFGSFPFIFTVSLLYRHDSIMVSTEWSVI